MGNKGYLQHTSTVDGSCVVYCRSQANLFLLSANHRGDAILLKVYDEDRNVFFVWGEVNQQVKETAFVAVFAEENELIPPIEDAEPVKIGEVFCHWDNYYVLTQNYSGDLVIRKLNVLSEEKMVRQILSDDDDFADIEEIFLSKLFAIGKCKEFVTLAWAVAYSDGCVSYIPVLHKDEKLLSKYNIPSLLKERVGSGLPVKMYDEYYTPIRDVLGKWHIECSKSLKLIPLYGVG